MLTETLAFIIVVVIAFTMGFFAAGFVLLVTIVRAFESPRGRTQLRKVWDFLDQGIMKHEIEEELKRRQKEAFW